MMIRLFSVIAMMAIANSMAWSQPIPAPSAKPSTTFKASRADIERGRYIAKIAGCNDCHTPGYAFSGGRIPEKEWLTGDRLGWRGPWGTTYPTNLRQFLAQMSEKDWLSYAKMIETRPPMPWFALRDMNRADLRALYRFVRWLGPAGDPAPTYVPPDQEAPQPYVLFPAPPK
jgi:mono/diheme cytochrome c family protein